MDKDALSVGTALVVTLMIFAGFISPVMALTDWDRSYSPDRTAYAYAAGVYTYPSLGYYTQYHEGKITEGNVLRYGFTRFRGFDSCLVLTYRHLFQLANNTGKSKIYGYEDIWFVETYTDSGYDTIPQSSVMVKIGPPGVQ